MRTRRRVHPRARTPLSDPFPLRLLEYALAKAAERQRLFVLFSGGKDSAAALGWTLEAVALLNQKPKVKALHVDTTIGIPQTEQYTAQVAELLGVPLETLRPETDYFSMAKRWGVPRPRARWCCFHLKIEPLKKYFARLPRETYLVVDGMRRVESRKRAHYPYFYQHPHLGQVFHPVIEWTGEEVGKYLSDRGIPINPVYEWGFNSMECWCGVFKRKEEFTRLKEASPELFGKLLQLESSFRSGYAYAYSNGKPLYLRDL